MTNEEKIQNLKKELLEEFGVKTDRDVVKQLGIENEDRRVLHKWIEYQCAYSYKEGFENGKNHLRRQLVKLLEPTDNF